MSYPGRDGLDPRLVELRRNRWAHQLADLRTDYAILDAWNAGATIRDIAAACGLSQDEVTWRVQHRPDQIPPVVAGRHGRRPMEVALRYAVGEITWSQARDDLITWPYQPEADDDPLDDGYTFAPGAGSELWLAHTNDYLSPTEYQEILDALDAHTDE